MNFLASNKVETIISKASNREHAQTSDMQGLRSMYLSGVLSAGASLRLSRIIAVNLMPTAQFGLSPINKNAPVKSSLSFYRLVTGISVRL